MIGLSSMVGSHNYFFSKTVELLRDKSADDIVVCGGGIISEDDIPSLKKLGIKKIFTPGMALDDIVRCVKENVKPR